MKHIANENFNFPSLLTATTNVVISDLDNTVIQKGETVNLYSKFPAGRLKKSKCLKQAFMTGLVVPAAKNSDL